MVFLLWNSTLGSLLAMEDKDQLVSRNIFRERHVGDICLSRTEINISYSVGQ